MAYLIALDDGHGMQTPGKRTPYISEIGRYIPENEFNRAAVRFLDSELRRCGFRTLLVAPTDADTSLKSRTDLANVRRADAYISIHYNAYDSAFNGYDPEGLSVHVYPGSKGSRKLAECVIKYLAQGTSQKNRGIQENDFHVLRETNMVAILSENGFMDNKREALLMLDVNFQKEVAVEHAKGICEYFQVPYVAEFIPNPVPQKTKEEFMMERAVVCNGLADLGNAEMVSAKVQAPIVFRNYTSGQKVARTVYIIGGANDTSLGETVVHLAGADRFATGEAVKKFLGR
jgi:N-acetylmuramoyl-L-alanine amidase